MRLEVSSRDHYLLYSDIILLQLHDCEVAIACSVHHAFPADEAAGRPNFKYVSYRLKSIALPRRMVLTLDTGLNAQKMKAISPS